jgi:hypothetical protein
LIAIQFRAANSPHQGEVRMSLKHVVGILAVGALTFGVQLGAAQYGDSQKTKPASPSKPAAAKPGGSHTMTGCLAKGTEPNTFMLTQIEGGGPKEAELIGAPASLKLEAHVGHKVAITGANVSTKAAAQMESGTKKPAKTEPKKEAAEHHMKPTAVKMIANSCM